MKIGFIGTGQITKAVVTGIISSKLKVNKIYISERNKKISKNLKSKSKKIIIIKILGVPGVINIKSIICKKRKYSRGSISWIALKNRELKMAR